MKNYFKIQTLVLLFFSIPLLGNAQMSKVMGLKDQANQIQSEIAELGQVIAQSGEDQSKKQLLAQQILEKAAQAQALNNTYKRALSAIRSAEARQLLKVELDRERSDYAAAQKKMKEIEAQLKDAENSMKIGQIDLMVYFFVSTLIFFPIFAAIIGVAGIISLIPIIGGAVGALAGVGGVAAGGIFSLHLGMQISDQHIFGRPSPAEARLLIDAAKAQKQHLTKRITQLEGEIYRQVNFLEMVNHAAFQNETGNTLEQKSLP